MSSEKTFANEEHVVGLNGVVWVGPPFFHAGSSASIQAQPALRSAQCGSTALDQCLLYRHVALDPVRAGPLNLSIYVKNRLPVHIDHIATRNDDVVLKCVLKKHSNYVDI